LRSLVRRDRRISGAFIRRGSSGAPERRSEGGAIFGEYGPPQVLSLAWGTSRGFRDDGAAPVELPPLVDAAMALPETGRHPRQAFPPQRRITRATSRPRGTVARHADSELLIFNENDFVNRAGLAGLVLPAWFPRMAWGRPAWRGAIPMARRPHVALMIETSPARSPHGSASPAWRRWTSAIVALPSGCLGSTPTTPPSGAWRRSTCWSAVSAPSRAAGSRARSGRPGAGRRSSGRCPRPATRGGSTSRHGARPARISGRMSWRGSAAG
jgi:hypothetical protein